MMSNNKLWFQQNMRAVKKNFLSWMFLRIAFQNLLFEIYRYNRWFQVDIRHLIHLLIHLERQVCKVFIAEILMHIWRIWYDWLTCWRDTYFQGALIRQWWNIRKSANDTLIANNSIPRSRFFNHVLTNNFAKL